MSRADAPTTGRGLALAVILGCQLMMVLDTSITTTALPHIQREFGFDTADLSWVQNAYVLAFGGLLLLGARAGDLLGRRRVFLVGVGLFTVASLGVGTAIGVPWLLAARVVQGLAAALAIPSTLALLIATFQDTAGRARAIALYSAVIGAGGSVGIVVGGVFTDLLSWRWGMLVNVPIGIAILLLAPRVLPDTARSAGRFDLVGALSSTLGMAALVFGFVRAAQSGWIDPVTVSSFVAAAVLLVTFVLVERRAEQPVTPLRLFRSMERSGAYAGRILIVGAMFSTFYFLSQYLQDVVGLTALQTGFAYVPITALFFAMVYVVGLLLRRFGRPGLLVVALIVALIGMLWLSRIDADSQYFPAVLLPLLLLGVGQGIAIILLTQGGVARVSPDDAGAASGLVNVAHQLGGSIGIAVLTIVFTAATTSAPHTPSTLASGFSAVFTGAAVFYSLALALAIAMLVANRRATPSPNGATTHAPFPRPSAHN